MEFEAVIGLEIHAELETRSKMFCACPVVDVLEAAPNTAVCPVCAGMPGVLPVINRRAVEYALRVALALECEIAPVSIFERKNYFYPDLPKGYQISQYQHPLAVGGRLKVRTSRGERTIRIRRVHLEEDTGKSTHVLRSKEDGVRSEEDEERDMHSPYSLIDLNRAGVPLLEIVTEPDLRTPEEVRAYAMGLRALLRYLGVNSGDMQKGLLRIEPNVSVRLAGSQELGTRTEVKNLNSFRALERAVAYEIERQVALLRRGQPVTQETVGWDEAQQITVPQRGKEEASDYRYFPEPDLPPLAVDEAWIASVRASLPELPEAKFLRFRQQYGLSEYDADVLVSERAVADYFEAVLTACPSLSPKRVANWVTGDLFGLMNQFGQSVEQVRVAPQAMGALLEIVARGEINQSTAKVVLAEMFRTGQSPEEVVAARGWQQVSDRATLAGWVKEVLAENPEQVKRYLEGKTTLAGWFFGQVMRKSGGQANPSVLREELQRELARLRSQG